MKIQVNQGQNIIKILSDNFGSCLVFERALTVNWPDYAGSIGEYYSISNHSNEERERLTTELNGVLINGNENDILESLNTFLNLFSNGEYEIHFYTLKIKEHSFLGQNQLGYAESVPENERFSGWFLPSFEEENIFNTIPDEKINPERVDFYIDLINKGSRPKIILFESYNSTISEWSSTYILDGHHKLEAYLKLGIDIPAVKILKQETEINDTEEIVKYIYPLLKDFELNHFVKNNDNIINANVQSAPYLTKVLDNILGNDKYIGSDIVKLMINIANSENEQGTKWLNERLAVLLNNKYIGRGLYLYEKGFDKTHNTECWHQVMIYNRYDLKRWIRGTIKSSSTDKDSFLLKFFKYYFEVCFG